MSRNDLATNELSLEELINAVKKRPFSKLRAAITRGTQDLDFQSISGEHRAGLTKVLKALLNEEKARSEIAGELERDHQDDEDNRIEVMQHALEVLVLETIKQSKAKINLEDSRAELDALKNSIKSLQVGITDSELNGSINGIVDAFVEDDIDAIRWRIVLLSLVVFQASEAKIRTEQAAEARMYKKLRERMKEIDGLVKSLFTKPVNETKHSQKPHSLEGISLDQGGSSNGLGFATLRLGGKRSGP